jgi:hypothetical protein
VLCNEPDEQSTDQWHIAAAVQLSDIQVDIYAIGHRFK